MAAIASNSSTLEGVGIGVKMRILVKIARPAVEGKGLSELAMRIA